MKLFFYIIIGLTLIGFLAATTRANTTETAEKAKAPSQKILTKTADKKTKKTAAKPNKKTGRFTPSEKISQDLSVSFPVDI